MKIGAKIMSDDKMIEAIFDATPWFKQVTLKEILDLERENWGYSYAADAVAEFFMQSNPDVKKIFDYIHIINSSTKNRQTMGFEVEVNQDEAVAWLKKNKPEIYNELEVVKENNSELNFHN